MTRFELEESTGCRRSGWQGRRPAAFRGTPLSSTIRGSSLLPRCARGLQGVLCCTLKRMDCTSDSEVPVFAVAPWEDTGASKLDDCCKQIAILIGIKPRDSANRRTRAHANGGTSHGVHTTHNHQHAHQHTQAHMHVYRHQIKPTRCNPYACLFID